jgi:hypothetical protein
MAKPKLGSGKRFKGLAAELAARGGVRNPKALAAHIGRQKYGNARMAQLSEAGRRRALRGKPDALKPMARDRRIKT